MRRRVERPPNTFDRGLQHERTTLAWERTAVSVMVVGVIMARYAGQSLHFGFAVVGLVQVVFGAVMLVWAGLHYDDLHGPLRAGDSPVHPTAARIAGVGTIVFCGLGFGLSLLIALD